MLAESSADPSQPSAPSSEPKATPDESPDPRPPIALPPGTRLREEYKIGPVLGTGSFGITYRARDRHLDTPVAIKEYYPRHLVGRAEDALTVRPHTDGDTDTFEYGRRRFREEAQMLARFDHPNIVQVHSYFEEHGTGYLVMDYYEGRTLAETLAHRGGILPADEAVPVVQRILRGLEPVHDAGVLHRDVDPQNVYRTEEGQVVLIDFGAAREAIGERSQSLSVVLKPGYAPYEQYHDSDNQGPWTDVYACAATLYKCLTGLRPPDATRRLEDDELVSPREAGADVSLELSLAVMKGLALHPEQRPASAAVYAQMLAEAQAGGGSTEQPSTTPAPDTAGTDVPSASPVEDASSPDRGHSNDPSGTSAAWTGGHWAFFAALTGVLGILFGIGDGGGATAAVSYVGTWLIVSLGLVGLFREAENAMTADSRATVRDWLIQQNLTSQVANWPTTFISLFDAVFTEDLFSWSCFKRSALVSIGTVLLLLVSVIGVGLIPADVFWSLLQSEGNPAWYNFLAFLSWALPFNVVVDYFSLLESRFVLGRMSRSDRPITHVAYLLLDLALTAFIFAGAVALMQPLVLFLFQGGPLFTAEGLHAIWVQIRDALSVMGWNLLHADQPPVVMIYSTLFTSVWVWLYAGAGLALRLLYPVLRGLDTLKGQFDVETRPVYSMGLLLAIVATGLFALASPFVL